MSVGDLPGQYVLQPGQSSQGGWLGGGQEEGEQAPHTAGTAEAGQVQ